MYVKGRFWVRKDGKNFLGEGRVELLKNIQQTGSIMGAAKAMKMSYKAAWDDVDAMNSLSDTPLVARAKGGKKGGGTTLTKEALELLDYFDLVQDHFNSYIERVLTEDSNSFKCVIENITDETGAVLYTLKSGDSRFYARLSTENRRFALGKKMIVKILPEALFVVLNDSLEGISADNYFKGVVEEIANNIVTIMFEHMPLHISVTDKMIKKLRLKKGITVSAACQARDVWIEPLPCELLW